MNKPVSDIAFTDSVKQLQRQAGSREIYEQMESGPGWRTTVDAQLRRFLAPLDMFYLATANAAGQPYVQYRGGPAGFLKVLDDKTLGFAEYPGNRQYISLGNLAENPRSFLFLMDYANRRRIKIWGEARAAPEDPALLEKLSDPAYPAVPERGVLFAVEAWDVNCPLHIHRRVLRSEVEETIQNLRDRVQELETQLAART